MKQALTNKQKKIAALIGIVLLLIVTILLVWLVGIPMIRYVTSEKEAFRLWMEEHGILGRLVFAGMVILQVIVAVIPGEPLEIAGGFAFGAWEGTFLCLLASFIGSVIVFLLVRKFGMKLVRIFFSEEKLKSVRFLQSSAKKEMLFLIVFMIPGTPKDLLCYFAGLTDIRLPVWLLICSFGRLPSLVTSTIGGSALGKDNYLMAGIVFAVTLLISGIGLLIYQRICKKHDSKEEKSEEKAQQ